MKISNEELRKAFSIRLQAELKRIGLETTAYTKITKEINQALPEMQVTTQAVRKWLLAETFPSQDKLVMLANWLGVSEHWLRYGSGERVVDNQGIPQDYQQTRMIFGYEYIRLIPLLDEMASLSDRDIRIVEALVEALRQEKIR